MKLGRISIITTVALVWCQLCVGADDEGFEECDGFRYKMNLSGTEYIAPDSKPGGASSCNIEYRNLVINCDGNSITVRADVRTKRYSVPSNWACDVYFACRGVTTGGLMAVQEPQMLVKSGPAIDSWRHIEGRIALSVLQEHISPGYGFEFGLWGEMSAPDESDSCNMTTGLCVIYPPNS